MGIEITRMVRRRVAGVPFEKIARDTLGKDYALSLVLSGDRLARRINRTYRKKDCAPNVLSFPLIKNEGEIFLNVRKAEREARSLCVSLRGRIAHLFVHGCLHLRGLRHGAKMEKLEKNMLEKSGF